MAKSKKEAKTAAAGDGNASKKRLAAKEHKEDSKKFKKAKPSIHKAAEELMCPILQDLPIDPVTAEDGQIYERKEIEKYLEKEGNAAISPVTRKKFKSKDLVQLIHVRNTIEHLVESGIIEGEMADTWKQRMKEKRETESKVKRWTEGAEKGDTDAMYELALCYEHGEYGFKKDLKEAYKWYKKGSDAGNVPCMASAGGCLIAGIGTAENVSEGLILISLAAGKGSNSACYSLGRYYYLGLRGIRKDIEKAKFWLEKAVAIDCEHDHLADECKEKARGRIAEINNVLET